MGETTTNTLDIGGRLGGRFQLERQLGADELSAVYEATDKETGRRVAIRVLLPASLEDDELRQRFVSESRQMVALQQDHTMRVLEVADTADPPFAVMEFLEGERLVDRVGRLDGLETAATASITRQVLESLSEAHAAGVIHRDLDSGRIWLCRHAGEERVKVIGFGLGKALRKGLWQDQKEATTLIGEPAYAAPEVLRGMRPTPASDVYSIGLILGEMLTGDPLVEGRSVDAVVRQQVGIKPLQLPDELAGHRLAPLIRKAIAKRPQERFANAHEMLAALDLVCPRARTEGSGKPAIDETTAEYPAVDLSAVSDVDVAQMTPEQIAKIQKQPTPVAGIPVASSAPVAERAAAEVSEDSKVGQLPEWTDVRLSDVFNSVAPAAKAVEPAETSAKSAPKVASTTSRKAPKRSAAPKPPPPRKSTDAPASGSLPKDAAARAARRRTAKAGPEPSVASVSSGAAAAPPALPPLPQSAGTVAPAATVALPKPVEPMPEPEPVPAPTVVLSKANPAAPPAPESVDSQPEPEASEASSPASDEAINWSSLRQAAPSVTGPAERDTGDPPAVAASLATAPAGDVAELAEVAEVPKVAEVAERAVPPRSMTARRRSRFLVAALLALLLSVAAIWLIFGGPGEGPDETAASTAAGPSDSDEAVDDPPSRNAPTAETTTSPSPVGRTPEAVDHGDGAHGPPVAEAHGPDPALESGPTVAEGVTEAADGEFAPPDETEPEPIRGEALPDDGAPDEGVERVALAAPPVDPALEGLVAPPDLTEAESRQEALDILQAALSENQISSDERADAAARLLDLHGDLVRELVDRDLCTAAEGRLERAMSARSQMPAGAEAELAALRGGIEACRERLQRPEWQPTAFNALVVRGTTRFDEAQALDEDDPETAEPRTGLLRQSLTAYQSAEVMLRSALLEDEVVPERREAALEHVEWLNQRIVSIQCATGRCAAAELYLDESTGDPDLLEADEALDLSDVRNQIEACRTRTRASEGEFEWSRFYTVLESGLARLTQPGVLALASIEPAPPPLVYSIRLRIGSRPGRARIYRDGERIGRTPFEGVIESAEDTVRLVVSKRDHDTETIDVDMMEGDASYTVRLRRSHPFGQLDTLGGD